MHLAFKKKLIDPEGTLCEVGFFRGSCEGSVLVPDWSRAPGSPPMGRVRSAKGGDRVEHPLLERETRTKTIFFVRQCW